MRLVCGVGINDADYSVASYQIVDGISKQVICPIYSRWKDVLRRVTSKAYHNYRPTYSRSSFEDNWKYFSRFRLWMSSQIWEGLHLDKDILFPGNKEYSERTCAFVPFYINHLVRPEIAKGESLPLGVAVEKRYVKLKKRYRSQIGVDGIRINLGSFETTELAHKAWQEAKANQIEKAVSRYATEECFRTDVAEALIKRVWDLKLAAANGVETKSL